MHLVVGVLNLLVANFLFSLYRALRLDFIGRAAVRRCCSAFTAGAGLDDGAMELLRNNGPNAIRLLEAVAARGGKRNVAHFVLKVLRS